MAGPGADRRAGAKIAPERPYRVCRGLNRTGRRPGRGGKTYLIWHGGASTVTRKAGTEVGYRSKITTLLSHTSVRTLILGVDQAGRIVQHDRNAQEILATSGGALLGTHLSDLVVETPVPGMPLNSLLEAATAGREATAVLTLRSQRSSPIDTVVTLQPMRGGNGCPSALAILRMPPPSVEQFLDPALMRHALLDETFRQIGATLDLDQMARGLINIVVPHFCNAAGLLLLESLVAADEPPAPQTDGSQLLRRMAIATDDSDPEWDAKFPTGEVMRFPPDSPHTRCMSTGKPIHVQAMTASDMDKMADS